MSRRGLRKIVTPPVSLLHDSDSDSSIEGTRTYEQVVTHSGMTLRSGVQLTREERLLAEQEERRRKNAAAGLSNSTHAMDGTPTGVLTRRYGTSYPSEESRQVTVTTTTNSYLMYEDSDDQKEDYLYSSGSGHKTRSQARSGQWFGSQTEEQSLLEKEQRESEYQSWISSKNQNEDSGIRLRHLYGMDQTDDVSDVDDIDMRHPDGKEWSAERRGLVSSFFYFIMTVVTTTVEYTYSAAKVATAPVRTYLVSPVYSRVSGIITWIDETICTIISYFLIWDAWILSRGMRNCCCLCLPLFLLPLLLGGGYYAYNTEWGASTLQQAYSWHTYLFEKESVVVGAAEQDSGPRQWLTRAEIERLVQGMLDPQIESLQLNVINIAKDGSSQQTTLQAGQEDTNLRLDSIEKQMAAFFSKTKEETVNILTLYNEMKPMVMKQDWLNRSQIEELVQSMLNLQMESLKLNLLNLAKEGSTDQDAALRLKAIEEKLQELTVSVKSTDLQQEVQQILLQVQKDEKRDWLSQAEIEVLVKGLLTSQMESLRLSLLSSLKEGSSEQGNVGVIQEEARLRLEGVEKQMAELRDRTQSTDLNERVQQIFLQLQKGEKREWLTESEIQALLTGLLSPQLEALRLSLVNIVQEGNTAGQDALKVSQEDARLRLDSVQQQLADLQNKAQNASLRLDALEGQLAGFVNQGKLSEGDLASLKEQLMAAIYAVRDNMEEKLKAQKTQEQEGWEAKLANMELTIADLRTVIQQTSQTSNKDIVALSEKCCKDEAALLALIRGEVGRMLAEKQQGAVGPVHDQDIQGLIDAALLKYSADKMDLPDYALESTGGSVVNIRCSKTYSKRAATVKVWGIPLYYTVNGPRTVIQPEVLPGNCWPFEGQEGSVVVQLAVPIKPTMFTLEHIAKSQSIFGNNRSAPKNFIVLGLSSESDTEGVILGEYQYDGEGMPMQHFRVQMEEPGIFLFIELRVTSNHGHEEYTCLYRFRVHGLPQEHN